MGYGKLNMIRTPIRLPDGSIPNLKNREILQFQQIITLDENGCPIQVCIPPDGVEIIKKEENNGSR